MTTTAAIKPATNDARSYFEPPSIEGSGARWELTVTGRRVTGKLILDKPNPKGRRKCAVDYITPKSWPDQHHAAALRVAVHWFRDIGGFGQLAKRQLCHVVQRLAEGVSEREMHAAIIAYATADWHREKRIWTTIQKFFLRDHLDKWIEESPVLRRERDRANQSEANTDYDRRMAEQRKQQRCEDAARRATQDGPASVRKRGGDNAAQSGGRGFRRVATSKVAPPASASEANDRLPQGERWVLPTLLSRKADRAAKARAKRQAMEVIVRIWPLLPARVRSQIEQRVQVAIYPRAGDVVAISDLPKHQRAKLRLAQLLAIMAPSTAPRPQPSPRASNAKPEPEAHADVCPN